MQVPSPAWITLLHKYQTNRVCYMHEISEIRNLLDRLNMINEKVDTTVTQAWLEEISPIFAASGTLVESNLGTTIAFVSVFLNGVEVTNVGPLDVNGAQMMKREITQDIERAYTNNHPHGFTDGTGTIYRMQDWDINIETCHSSECNAIVGPRMDAIRDRAAKRTN